MCFPVVELLFACMCVSVLQASVRDQKKLLVENSKLKKDIEQLKGQLQDKQRRRTGMQNYTQNGNVTQHVHKKQPQDTICV